MADATHSIEEELLALRREYKARLLPEILELSDYAKSLVGNEINWETLEALHRRLHKLAGSGGSFGFTELSKQARQLEMTANDWLKGSATLDHSALALFSRGVANLAAMVNEKEAGALHPANPVFPRKIGQPARIWVADEDPHTGSELQRLLSQFGYEVRLFERFAALSGDIATETPDLLILNIKFKSEYIDSTLEIKSTPSFRALRCPVIFTASEENFEARVRAVRAGAFGFLVKPLEASKLITQIERALGQETQSGYRVLIVDDDTALAEHYRLALSSAGMEVSTLNEPGRIIERMNEFHPELILMDIYMPEYTGTELAAIIRQHEEWLGLPIVYLSAETDVDEQIRVMGVGADDFLAKPISATRLIAAVKVRAARARQLSDLMTRDSLTGLLKHASLKEALSIEHLRAKRNHTPIAVIMADIDHFKTVNDTYGHATGDNVIRAISYLLRQRLRKSDIIGRYGGEEFVAVLPECNSETARQLMDDIRERFSSLRFHHQNDEFSCTLSAGIMCTELAPEATSGELLVMADEALYHSKHTGRNRVSVYESIIKT